MLSEDWLRRNGAVDIESSVVIVRKWFEARSKGVCVSVDDTTSQHRPHQRALFFMTQKWTKQRLPSAVATPLPQQQQRQLLTQQAPLVALVAAPVPRKSRPKASRRNRTRHSWHRKAQALRFTYTTTASSPALLPPLVPAASPKPTTLHPVSLTLTARTRPLKIRRSALFIINATLSLPHVASEKVGQAIPGIVRPCLINHYSVAKR